MTQTMRQCTTCGGYHFPIGVWLMLPGGAVLVGRDWYLHGELAQ